MGGVVWLTAGLLLACSSRSGSGLPGLRGALSEVTQRCRTGLQGQGCGPLEAGMRQAACTSACEVTNVTQHKPGERFFAFFDQ